MGTNELIHLGSRKKIAATRIIMLKSELNYTTIYLDDGSKILSSTTMGKIEKRLKHFQFFRPNRSTVFNLAYMASHGVTAEKNAAGNIWLKNNVKISLSRRRIEAFLKIVE